MLGGWELSSPRAREGAVSRPLPRLLPVHQGRARLAGQAATHAGPGPFALPLPSGQSEKPDQAPAQMGRPTHGPRGTGVAGCRLAPTPTQASGQAL